MRLTPAGPPAGATEGWHSPGMRIQTPSVVRRRVPVAGLVAFLAFGCTTHWETQRSVDIAAPPATVWEVLVDLPGYPDWNSYSPRAEGELRPGGVVTITAKLGEEVQVVDNRVTVVEPGRRLCWHSMNWYQWLARGTRCRILEPAAHGATHFVHHEVMEGPLAGLIEALYRPRIDAGLERMNADLKREAEARVGSKPEWSSTENSRSE